MKLSRREMREMINEVAHKMEGSHIPDPIIVNPEATGVITVLVDKTQSALGEIEAGHLGNTRQIYGDKQVQISLAKNPEFAVGAIAKLLSSDLRTVTEEEINRTVNKIVYKAYDDTYELHNISPEQEAAGIRPGVYPIHRSPDRRFPKPEERQPFSRMQGFRDKMGF
mgnify:CR=1 FL=1|tara:strand:- start:16008 stop:16508 length:501 start_codon:yes stop_codon:yes gene_type:complete